MQTEGRSNKLHRIAAYKFTLKLYDITRMNPLHKLGKGKAVPLQAWSGPEGSRKLRFNTFLHIGTGWW